MYMDIRPGIYLPVPGFSHRNRPAPDITWKCLDCKETLTLKTLEDSRLTDGSLPTFR